ncbi:MAG: ComEA family DNA-binding protein [Phycisphaerales bacterium]
MEHQTTPTKHADWSRTPAGMFAAAVLGIASLTGLVWSVTHTQQPIQQASTELASQPQTPARLLIDLNTATTNELQLLPSIGPNLARRIVNDRDEQGPYESLSDLDRVRGIGPKTIAKLDDWVTLSTP